MKVFNGWKAGGAIALVLLALTSCNRQKSPPPGVLSKQEMAQLMMQMYMGESRALNWAVPRDSAYKLFAPFQDSIFRKKGYTDSVLLQSYKYYVDHPKEMEAIYDAMIDSMSLMEQRLRQSPQPAK